MQKRLLLGHPQLAITIGRLCQQLIENHQNFNNTVLLGLQPRGIFLARKIKERLSELIDTEVSLGYLDATFFRDDFRRRDSPVRANETKIDFLIEGKKVILVDDVFYTGRSVRAALDAMNAFGRPEKVELLSLVVRKYAKHVPIFPDYVGKEVNTLDSQKVLVEWKGENDAPEDTVWLINKEEA
ncbi:bifunctional pyr operon transcriptional regulator/uracil phosphoribosyltransferase PyrR [Roseivirga sp. E12]|uniref:bifunctional pyr operon transcriptional regulator/uracil phosphoribosyltransferase PyrR n=1 Tax=Roseivirga sp. E12 TaxID=2819237 RepID=UPI001ABC3156|nr:bifunctional pyr operon transcriptional regulator/uracil phosphoribosyltransferase PyrR [Roseivirga sp. E12]MBO3700758.1 bifunctional pyr operon transcriptional regulator/uracil phosphoribosyltransferase PyrR [Roseivirga sp. E12]